MGPAGVSGNHIQKKSERRKGKLIVSVPYRNETAEKWLKERCHFITHRLKGRLWILSHRYIRF